MILDPALFAAYLVAATALALSPGPDTMFVLASSASGGQRAGVAATLGIATGGLVHAALAALGVSALIAASPEAFDALRIAGAFYLAWMAFTAFRAFAAGLRGRAASPPDAGENVSWLAGLAIVSGRTAQAMARNPRVRAWLDGAAGTVYILLALRMLFLERRPA